MHNPPANIPDRQFTAWKSVPAPHFIGMGAQKAATSWLFKMLSMHPDVYFPRGKEIAFWNGQFDKRANIRSYLQAFREGTAAALGGFSGEITPLYMIIPEDDIAFMRQVLPDVKLLFIARNPVERAISGSDFHMKFRAHQVSSYDALLFSPFITNCGLYMKYLDNWLRHFPRESIHFIIQDDIKDDPRAIMRGVAQHIGLDPAIWEQIPAQFLQQRSNAAERKTQVSPEVRGRLKELYRADVERLSQALGRDLTHWVK